jgi:RNA polymerase sigma-70 factor (ECF subfamily)
VTNTLDTHNFLEIFDTYNGQIYGYVFLRSGRNKEIAEDLTQEIFIKAWKARRSFDDNKASIKTWLYTIARNSITDYWRKARVDSVDEQTINQVPYHEAGKLESELLIMHVRDQLTKLDQLSQDLITWRFIQGLELDEIAVITGKTYNATKVAVFRALQNLKQLINA